MNTVKFNIKMQDMLLTILTFRENQVKSLAFFVRLSFLKTYYLNYAKMWVFNKFNFTKFHNVKAPQGQIRISYYLVGHR